MEELLRKKNYICKPILGLIMNCKLISGLIIKTVNFFQDETVPAENPQ